MWIRKTGEGFARNSKKTVSGGNLCLFVKEKWREFLCRAYKQFAQGRKGNPATIYGVFRDISERKKVEMEIVESEKKYRLLFNSLKEGVYQCEPEVDGVFTWVNQAGAEILGYKSPEEVIGTKVKDIYVNPDDRKN